MQEITKPPMPVLIKDLGMMYPKESSKQKRRYGLYKCACGVEFKATTNHVNTSHTKSCGCYDILTLKKRATTHGMSRHAVYITWFSMHDRCENNTSSNYINYGGRGITVCEKWKTFENFRDDMFHTWSKGLTIDRIDVNGNYEPNNCRWATRVTQAQNTRLIRVNNKSGYRGVSFYKSTLKWVCHIGVNGKVVGLGYFNTALEAAKAYDTYVINNGLEHTLNRVL